MLDSGPGDRSNTTDDSALDVDATESTDGSVAGRSIESVRNESVGDRRPDVIVPLAIYKRVTVVSTVLASVIVVVGFLFLDAATKQTRLLRGPIETGLGWVGIGISAETLSILLGVAGLGSIAIGAAIYVFGARFRTAGMGSDKTDANASDDNG
jgi:hypothetical protein